MLAIPLSMVRAAFVYVAFDDVFAPADLLDADGLAALLTSSTNGLGIGAPSEQNAGQGQSNPPKRHENEEAPVDEPEYIDLEWLQEPDDYWEAPPEDWEEPPPDAAHLG